MSGALKHRGPDGYGEYFGRDIGLAHRRLAIIDLDTGSQPLEDAHGVVLAANAEIYNHIELRAELRDAQFLTRSACEPILPLSLSGDSSYAQRLRGMYAYALYDARSGELQLCRDPFGIKPLYYLEWAGGLAFASEPSALLAAALIKPQVNAAKREELLQLQFTTGSETIFQGINRVLPGETLTVRQGKIIERRRLAALPAGAPSVFEQARALKLLDTVLVDTVNVHQRSDVPYGMFLSGGIDSAALLTLMAELNESPVVAYTAGFEGDAPDERDRAAELAAKAGAEHITLSVSQDDFLRRLPEIVGAMDDPAADYACLPSFLLAERAARDVKVVLTGEGGDEIFGGYGRYRSALRPLWLGGRAMRSRGALGGLGLLREESSAWRDGLVAAASVAQQGGRTRLQAAQALDCEDWLPHDLLAKVDRCLMAHGLEGRTPFLDPLVAATAFRFDDRLKVRKGLGKYVLRQWLASRMPKVEAFSRKRGFTVPVAQWIRECGDKLAPIVARQPAIAELCRPDQVHALFRGRKKRHGRALWNVLFYAVWDQVHIRGVKEDGDLFDVLDAR